MRRLTIVLFTLVLCLTGCRDALVDEPLPVGQEPPPQAEPADNARSIYVKGVETLALGTSSNYRAELLPAATRYTWLAANGEGEVLGRATDSLRRNYEIEALRQGDVVLVVRAYDAESRLIGRGTKTIRITGR